MFNRNLPPNKREYFVIACGTKCPNHPHDRWVSLDIAPEQNPDICKALELLEENDFKRLKIKTPFKIIFLEGITSAENIGDQEKRITNILKFLSPQGVLITECSNYDIETLASVGMKISHYFFTDNANQVFVAEGGSLNAALLVMKNDLYKDQDAKSYESINKLALEFKRVEQKYPELNTLLVSVLAHLSIYKNSRKERFFRNWFKDESYGMFFKEIENKILNYNDKKISADDLINSFYEWQERLPSTSTPPHKLSYTPLYYVIRQCIKAVSVCEKFGYGKINKNLQNTKFVAM